MRYQGFKCSRPHRDISEAYVARPKPAQRPFLIDKDYRARIIGTLLADVCEVDWASPSWWQSPAQCSFLVAGMSGRTEVRYGKR